MHNEFSSRQGIAPAAVNPKLEQGFASPDFLYAPSAFWFWNAKEELSDPAHFAKQAEGMSAQGINPGFVHARCFQPHTPFWLSDDWYKCFASALESSKKCGSKMTYTMGDPCFPEKYLLASHSEHPKFPVGGLMLTDHPELRAASLDYTVQDIAAGDACELPFSFFCVAAKLDNSSQILSATLTLIGGGEAFVWQAPQPGNWRVYAFSKMYDFPSQFKINFLDRRLAEPWLRIENAKYEQLFSRHFGATMPGVFFDLEGFIGYKIVWSEDMAEFFQKTTGTDIRLRIPLLIEEDVEGLWPKARNDWFAAAAQLYEECVFEPLDEWCRSKGMYSTCHFWEESLFVQATCVADFMKMQRRLSMPGTDALFQTIHEPRYFRESQSVSEFEGRQLMCEAFGIIGWHVTPAELKMGANSAIAMGVTQMIPHGVNSSRSLSNTCYPPDFYDWNPYWRHFHLWSDFVRRASYVNDQGRLDARVLLFCPLESVCALVGGGYFDPRQTTKGVWFDENEVAIPRKEEIVGIEKSYTAAMQTLYDSRIDALVADSHYLGKMLLQNSSLTLGDFSFNTIILPPLKLVPLATAQVIVDFAIAGGRVYGLGALPDASAENGLGDPVLTRLMDTLKNARTFTDARNGLKPLLDAGALGLAPCVKFESGDFPMIASRRNVGGQNFFWLANNGESSHDFVLRIAQVDGGASIWNCENGSNKPLATQQMPDGTTRVELRLEPYEGYWLVFDSKQKRKEGTLPQKSRTVRTLSGDWRVSVDTQDQPDMAQHKLAAPDWLFVGKKQRPLESWLEWGLKQFTGFVDYEMEVTLDNVSGDETLDLGEVKYVAAVWVNGEPAGERMWAPFRFAVGRYLKEGNNHIKVKVGNLILNAVTQYKDYKWKWFQPPTDAQLDCGMFGPVILKTGQV